MSWFEKLGAIKTASQTLRLRMAKAAQNWTAHDHVMAPRPTPAGVGTGAPRGVFRDADGREYYASGVGEDRLYTDTLPPDRQEREQQLAEFDRRQKQQLAQHRAERLQRQEAWATGAEQERVQRPPQAQTTEQDAQVPQGEAVSRAAPPAGYGGEAPATQTPDLGQTFNQSKVAAEYDQRSGVWRNTGRNSPGNGNDAVHQTRQTTSTQTIGKGLMRRSCAPAAKLGAAVVRSIQRRKDRSEPT